MPTTGFRSIAGSLLAGAVLALSIVLAPPAAASAATPLHITELGQLSFSDFSCRADEPLVCDVKATGPVSSNLSATNGTVEYTLVIINEGFVGSPCNTVEETAVFTFDSGTITTESVHRDCPATIRPGPRVQGTFTVVGGTGAFAGATGGGSEVAQGRFIYNGFITV